jgi:hypothetical protein
VHVRADGRVEPLPGHELFPDVGGRIVGAPNNLPELCYVFCGSICPISKTLLCLLRFDLHALELCYVFCGSICPISKTLAELA